MLTHQQAFLMAHTLGEQTRNGKLTRRYRNFYLTDAGSPNALIWDELVATRLASRQQAPLGSMCGDTYYSVTPDGERALDAYNEAYPSLTPCISLHQPYASLVVWGEKRVESRDWPAPRKHWGKRIAIHAAKSMEHWQYLWFRPTAEREFFWQALTAHVGEPSEGFWRSALAQKPKGPARRPAPRRYPRHGAPGGVLPDALLPRASDAPGERLRPLRYGALGLGARGPPTHGWADTLLRPSGLFLGPLVSPSLEHPFTRPFRINFARAFRVLFSRTQAALRVLC